MRIGMIYILTMILSLLLVSSGYSQDIVVNKDLPVDSITIEELRSIYFGKKMFWKTPYGDVRIHAIFNREEVRNIFFELINASEIGYKKNWIRLTLSGKTSPPQGVKNDDEVFKSVAQQKGGIGFVSRWQNTEGVKIIRLVE